MLQKQSIDINFAQGLDEKTDPKRVQPGRFLALSNSVFTKAGLLTKRNGFGILSALSDASSLFLTTFNGNLTAIGNSISAYSSANKSWINKGAIKPIDLSVLSLIKSNTNQTQCDSVTASNNLICTVFSDINASTTTYKYVIADSVTGQNIIAPTLIPVASGVVTGSPRVFLLGSYFIIVFTNVISATSHLQYIAISTSNPTVVTTAADIASAYVSSTRLSWDGVVANSALYIGYNTTTGGQSIKVTYLNSALVVATAVTFASRIATIMSMTADISIPTAPIIYASFYDGAGSTAYTLAVDKNLNTVLAPTQYLSTGTIVNVTSSAIKGVNTILYEVTNAYSYDSGLPTNYIATKTVTQAGTVGSQTIIRRSVGLASKSAIIGSTIYVLSAYSSTPQPTYFLLDSTGTIYSKLAYGNGGGYLTKGLPNLFVIGNIAQVSYLIKDLVASVNKGTALAASVPIAAVYSQTGINLASFNVGVSTLTSAEIGANLNISGALTIAYDGYTPVEQGFHLWPDNVEVTTATGSGAITAQQYYYQVTYEWSDNQGNLFRSAPSIPVAITTTTSSSTNTINVPTLRVTSKTANPVKIVVYRWSVAQQVYYQITSITSPTLNDTTTDSVAIVDALADSAIIGNNILYTTGGVIENIGMPATSNLTLFNDRLFFIYSEDRNLLGFSKQVIEATPVESSDLLTIYVAPSIGSQGSTGPMTAISAMDDKLIIFKANAIYYINGTGPDNTGSNSQYSDATFITSVIGCSNQNSIAFIPTGLVFQSDKGIWLLDRNLNTSYIGAPVETDTIGAVVESAIAIPGTTQIRFTMNTGITLMYDYFYSQWGSFSKIPAISSTLYQGMHTYLDSSGRVFQETAGIYLDNTSPVLMSFTTGWMNFAGFQGFERFYFMFLNGTYITPFNLYCSFAYNFNTSASQATRVIPENAPSTWGSLPLWGSGDVWGGKPNNFECRVFPEVQKCESFQVIVQELFDASYGVAAGAGLTLSGMNIVAGVKKGYRTSSAVKSFG